MEIVKLITKVIDRAVARNIKFFCNECEKEIIISDVDGGYYEDWEDTGIGYFPEGNVFIDFNQGDVPRTHMLCKECYEEASNYVCF